MTALMALKQYCFCNLSSLISKSKNTILTPAVLGGREGHGFLYSLALKINKSSDTCTCNDVVTAVEQKDQEVEAIEGLPHGET